MVVSKRTSPSVVLKYSLAWLLGGVRPLLLLAGPAPPPQPARSSRTQVHAMHACRHIRDALAKEGHLRDPRSLPQTLFIAGHLWSSLDGDSHPSMLPRLVPRVVLASGGTRGIWGKYPNCGLSKASSTKEYALGQINLETS